MARGATRRRDFDYQPPSYEETVERADRQGSMYDNLFKGVKTFKAAEGRNIVRILPPTWDKPTHYGYPIWVHYGIGPKEAAYLCLRENKTSPYKRCPLCEELYALGNRASPEDRKLLLPTQSIIYYILDRNQPQQGVLLWRVSGTADSEIAAQSVNRRKGSVLNIVDTEVGYDLEFMRSGQKLNTRYRGYQVVREDSPVTDDDRSRDEVFDFILDNPLPDCLNFYRPEHIEAVYSGKISDDDEDDDRRRSGNGHDRDEERSPRMRSRARDDDDDEPPPRSRSRSRDDDDDDRPPARSRSRARDDDDDDRPPARSTRSRAAEPDDEPPYDPDDDDEPPPRRSRPSRLAREIDDEIPERGARSTRSRRVAVEDDEEPPPPSRSRREEEPDDRRERLRRNLRRE